MAVRLTHIERMGKGYVAIFDNGARVYARAGIGGLWHAGANDVTQGVTQPPPDPPDPLDPQPMGSAFKWPFPDSAITGGVNGPNEFRSSVRPTHTGRDYGMPPAVGGAPLRAIGDGVVHIAYHDRMSPFGGGHEVQINHGRLPDGQVYFSFYSHARAGSVRVRAGQPVKQGDHLSDLGTTGNSTGNHLHFSITRGNAFTFIDPRVFMRAFNPNNEVL